MNVDIAGEVLALASDIDTLADDDPVISSLQSAQDLLNHHWTPTLNIIEEETQLDIRIEEHLPIVKQTSHVSAKRQRGRVNRCHKWINQYENKVSKAIAKIESTKQFLKLDKMIVVQTDQ